MREHLSKERLQMSLGYYPEVKLNEYLEHLSYSKGLIKRDHLAE